MTPRQFELQVEKTIGVGNYVWALIYSLMGLLFMGAVIYPTHPVMAEFGFWKRAAYKLAFSMIGLLPLWVGVSGFYKLPRLMKVHTIHGQHNRDRSWSRFSSFCHEHKFKIAERTGNYALARGLNTRFEWPVLIEHDRVLYNITLPATGRSLPWLDLGSVSRMHKRFIAHMTAEEGLRPA